MTETGDSSSSAAGDVAADVDASRIRAATALRRLGHALVGHEADPDLLERIAELADRTAATVEEGTRRSRPIEAIKRRLWESPPPDGGPMGHFPECVVSGQGNPMGIALSVRRVGDEALATVSLGPAFEGAPGRAHGGVVAAVFDDVMGYVLQLTRTPAYTGRLTVSYRAPVPLGRDLHVRGWLVHRSGRKLTINAEMSDNGELISEAEGLFIAIPPERLGLPPETAQPGTRTGRQPSV
jgi:acyl-coenzyme A thioesterase PaaI-like protein